MSTESRHLGDVIHELLDDRLDPGERTRAEVHLAECVECRRELDALRWAKGVAARGRTAPDAPPEVASAISRALDADDRRATSPRPWKGWPALRPALAAAALLTVAGLSFHLWRGGEAAGVPAAVARDYASVRSGRLSLDLRTTNTEQLEDSFAANGIPFETRVFDLAMMGYRVRGGRVHALAGGPSALFVYEGAEGRLLLCQMYRGRLAALPRPPAVREHDGIRFHVHHHDGITLVFWEEGDVVCVLASEIAPEDVVQLAFAKAMKVVSRGPGRRAAPS